MNDYTCGNCFDLGGCQYCDPYPPLPTLVEVHQSVTEHIIYSDSVFCPYCGMDKGAAWECPGCGSS